MKRLRFIPILLVCLSLAACSQKENKPVDAQSISGDLQKLNEAIAQNPEDHALLYNRATYYYGNKQIPEALEDILAAIKLDENNSDYYILLSDIYFAQRETDLAEENLQKVIAMNPNANEARLKLAELYYYLNMLNECEHTIDEATKINPHNPTAYLIKAFCMKEKGDTTNYLQLLYYVIDQNPSEMKAHLELGYYYQSQNNPQAILHYQNALLVDPNNEEINYNLASLYANINEVDKAIEQYNILLSFAKEGIYAKNAYYNLAYLEWTAKQDYDAALQLFTHAIELDKEFVNAYAARGEVYEILEQYDKAEADYRHCLSLEDNHEAALLGMQSLEQKGVLAK